MNTYILRVQPNEDTYNLVINGIVNSGESAYQIAVRNGFVGTESEWIEALQGVDVNYTLIYQTAKL